MAVRTLLVLSTFLVLTGCSNFSFSDFFGGDDDLIALYPEEGFAVDNDLRQAVSQVSDLTIAQAAGGVIIHATGLPSRQGFWAGELIAENDERPVDGVLTYVFRIAEPYTSTRAGTPYSRQVVVAHFVSDVKLQDVTQIRVLGEQNSRSARR